MGRLIPKFFTCFFSNLELNHKCIYWILHLVPSKNHTAYFFIIIALYHGIVKTNTNKKTKQNKKNEQCENLNFCCPWVTLGERRIDRKLISLFLWNTLMRKPSLSALKIPTLTASKYHSVFFHVYIHHHAFTNLIIFLLHKYVKILLCFFELTALSSLITQGHWE